MVGPTLIIVVAVLANLLQMKWGASCGHDFDFHFVSWLDVKDSWRVGMFYPHWAPSPNFDAGEPRFVFYPPLTWMLGAALSFFMAWKTVPVVMCTLLLAATGLATRKLAREALSEVPATLAGCTAMLCGYAMYTTYERSAYGELTGGFWIPLMLVFLLRDRKPDAFAWRRALDGSAVPLTLVLAGAWLSNAPLGVIASYLLGSIALVAALQLRSLAPILRAAIAVVLGLGLSALYVVPAAVEQRWIEIRQATEDPGSQIQNSWMFARHADPALELHDVELAKVSGIGAIMISVTLISVCVCWRLDRLPGPRHWWIPLALIPVAVLLLQFPISLPAWNLLPKLRFLQFPWRWLVVLEAPVGIFLASALRFSRPRPRIIALIATAVVFAGVTTTSSFVFFQFCDPDDAALGMFDAYRHDRGFEGTDEYATPGADNSLIPIGLPGVCFTPNPDVVLGQGEDGTTPTYKQGACEATFNFTGNPARGPQSAEHLRVAAVTPHAGYLVLRLRTYPAWKIRVDGQSPGTLPPRPDGLAVVPVPAGPTNLTIDWTTTGDVVVGRCLSSLALALVASLCLIERKTVVAKSQPAIPRLS
jgi:hypothetical protein